jgi:hypothetical protein
MEGKKIKILSDLNGLITLRYTLPSTPEQMGVVLAPVVSQLLNKIKSPPLQTVKTGDLAHPDVNSLLETLRAVVAERRAKSQSVKIQNLALDMETTWPYLRDKYLTDKDVSGISWKTLMVDPISPAIRTL